MRFSTFLKCTLSMTFLSLVYIHMQMQIFDLAYRGKVKEKQIFQLKEEKQNLTSKILKLKSANNLGDHLLGSQSKMEFIRPQDVIEIKASRNLLKEDALAKKEGNLGEKKSFLLSLLPRESSAEAKTKE